MDWERMTNRPSLRESVAVLVERVCNFMDQNKKDHEELKTSMTHCNHEIELLTEKVEGLEYKFKIQDAINKVQKTRNEDSSKNLYRKLRDLSIVAATSVSVTTIILNLPRIIQLLKGN